MKKEDKRVFCPSYIHIDSNVDNEEPFLESTESMAVTNFYDCDKPISGAITEILKTNKVTRLYEGYLSFYVIEDNLMIEVQSMCIEGMSDEQINQVIFLFLKQEGIDYVEFCENVFVPESYMEEAS